MPLNSFGSFCKANWRLICNGLVDTNKFISLNYVSIFGFIYSLIYIILYSLCLLVTSRLKHPLQQGAPRKQFRTNGYSGAIWSVTETIVGNSHTSNCSRGEGRQVKGDNDESGPYPECTVGLCWRNR